MKFPSVRDLAVDGIPVTVTCWPPGRGRARRPTSPPTRRLRLALGETRDLVMIDVAPVGAVPTSEAPATLAEGTSSRWAETPIATVATTSTWCSDPSAFRFGERRRTPPNAPSCASGCGWSELSAPRSSAAEPTGRSSERGDPRRRWLSERFTR